MGSKEMAGHGSGDLPNAVKRGGNRSPTGGGRHEQLALDRYEIPGTIPASGYHVYAHSEHTRATDSDDALDWVATDDWFAFDVYIPEGGTYELTVRVACDDDYGGGDFGIAVDTEPQRRVKFGPTGGWHCWESVSTHLELPRGASTLRLVVFAGGWLFDSLELR